MKVLVCVKPVFNSEAEIDVNGTKISSTDSDLVINPFDEYAVEAALQLKERYDAHITAVTVGDPNQYEALRHTLAMGADEAVLIETPNCSSLDSKATALLIGAYFKEQSNFDLVIFGRQTIEYGSGLLPAQFSRIVGLPYLGLVGKIDINGELVIDRVLDDRILKVSCRLPASISVVQSIGEPRYPSFMGIRKSKKAEIPSWSPNVGYLPQNDLESLSKVKAVRQRSECVILRGEDPTSVSKELVNRIMGEKLL